MVISHVYDNGYVYFIYVYVLLPNSSYRIHYFMIMFFLILAKVGWVLTACQAVCWPPQRGVPSPHTWTPGRSVAQPGHLTAAGRPPGSESWCYHLVFHLGQVLWCFCWSVLTCTLQMVAVFTSEGCWWLSRLSEPWLWHMGCGRCWVNLVLQLLLLPVLQRRKRRLSEFEDSTKVTLILPGEKRVPILFCLTKM